MPQIPLVIYDLEGNRKVIGTANVKQVGMSFEISGDITDPEYVKLVQVNNPDWYSIGLLEEVPVEATIVPPASMPKEI